LLSTACAAIAKQEFPYRHIPQTWPVARPGGLRPLLAFKRKRKKNPGAYLFIYHSLASADAPVLFCVAPLTPGGEPTSSLLTRATNISPRWGGLVFAYKSNNSKITILCWILDIGYW